MNVFLGVLASINFLHWLSTSILWFKEIKKIPVFRETDPPHNKDTYPSLSVIVPACNEEDSIEQAVRKLICQDYPGLEVIVVNDRSTDRTGEILQNLEGQYPELKIINIKNLPPNWLGKNHAIYQGVKEATGEWLLFTDADIMYSPDSLKKTINYALEQKLDHLTVRPDMSHEGIFYSAFIAYFTIIATFMWVFTKSMGLGAFNLIKKPVYKEIGGYEAIALLPADDMSLGKLVVKDGYKQGVGCASNGFITVKWYDNLLAMLKGMEKNQFAYLNYSIATALILFLYSLVANVYPYIGLFFGPIWVRVLCGLTVLILFTVYNNIAKFTEISRSHVLIHPISALLYLGAMINSTIKTLKRGGIEWRGTFYSLEELKKQTMR